jgi:predicted DNA-binding protein (MmcQ/YjbR family)
VEHDKERRIQSPQGLEWLGKVRLACKPLPEVVEKIDGFGHTAFRVNDKPFVIMGESESGTSISIKCDLHTQDILLQQGTYTKTPYIGQHGWVTLRSLQAVPWKEQQELIEEAYYRVAPKRLLKQLKEAAK